MKRRTRRILFLFAVLIFAGASWIAIRYAQGYVFDFRTNMFVHTGAISVGVNTSDATFLVDDRTVGKTSLLSHTIGKDRLVPGTYMIRLTKEGWSSWKKSATVQEGFLTEFPHVLLLPTDSVSKVDLRVEASNSFSDSLTLSLAPKPKRGQPREVIRDNYLLREKSLYRMEGTASASLIAENVLGFSAIDDGNQVLWWSNNEVWVRWNRDTNQQPYRMAGERLLVTRVSSPITRASWFRGSYHVVIDLGADGYRVIETDTRGGTNIIRF